MRICMDGNILIETVVLLVKQFMKLYNTMMSYFFHGIWALAYRCDDIKYNYVDSFSK